VAVLLQGLVHSADLPAAQQQQHSSSHQQQLLLVSLLQLQQLMGDTLVHQQAAMNLKVTCNQLAQEDMPMLQVLTWASRAPWQLTRWHVHSNTTAITAYCCRLQRA
jgi:hypothetical protein